MIDQERAHGREKHRVEKQAMDKKWPRKSTAASPLWTRRSNGR